MNTPPHLTADDRGVMLRCPHCQKLNRLPFSRIGQAGHCGGCKAELPYPSAPVEIESARTFQALVAGATLPVLVDFWAPWCGPCQMVAPEVARLASLVAGEALVVKVDTESQPDLGAALRIRSIPTFVVFAGGREIQRTSGGMRAEQLRALITQALPRTEAER